MAFAGFAVVTGILHSLFEDQNLGEGLWWALVTLTTVGYGDVGSVTAGGRLTGAALMIVGIGVLAFITANIAAYFVEDDYRSELRRNIEALNQRLDRLEELLVAQAQPEEDD